MKHHRRMSTRNIAVANCEVRALGASPDDELIFFHREVLAVELHHENAARNCIGRSVTRQWWRRGGTAGRHRCKQRGRARLRDGLSLNRGLGYSTSAVCGRNGRADSLPRAPQPGHRLFPGAGVFAHGFVDQVVDRTFELVAQPIVDLMEIVPALKRTHRFSVALISHFLDYFLLPPCSRARNASIAALAMSPTRFAGGLSSDQPSPATCVVSAINCFMAGTFASPPLRSR